MILRINCLLLHSEKAFFLIMQNKTDKGASLVSKSLPVGIFNSVNRLFSRRKISSYVFTMKCYILDYTSRLTPNVLIQEGCHDDRNRIT